MHKSINKQISDISQNGSCFGIPSLKNHGKSMKIDTRRVVLEPAGCYPQLSTANVVVPPESEVLGQGSAPETWTFDIQWRFISWVQHPWWVYTTWSWCVRLRLANCFKCYSELKVKVYKYVQRNQMKDNELGNQQQTRDCIPHVEPTSGASCSDCSRPRRRAVPFLSEKSPTTMMWKTTIDPWHLNISEQCNKM